MRRLRDTGFRLADFFPGDAEVRESLPGAPRMVVRCLATESDRLLLCRRADSPRLGKWSLPGGYVEPGESLAAAAARETSEETDCTVQVGQLVGVFDMPQLHEVIFVFRAALTSTAIRCGPEALEARLFAPESLPWEELAFPSDREVLQGVMAAGLDRPTSLLAELLWDEDGCIRIRER